MSAGASSPGSSNQVPQSTVPDGPPAESASRQELLEQVLQATLAFGPGNEQLRPEDLNVLLSVARRRRAEPLSQETVTELVAAILRQRFRSLATTRDQWDRLTGQIAETMWQDPQTQPRLHDLWTKLCEAVP